MYHNFKFFLVRFHISHNTLYLCILLVLFFSTFFSRSYCESSSNYKETAILAISLLTGTVILVVNYLAKQNRKIEQESIRQQNLDQARQVLDQVENSNVENFSIGDVSTSATNSVSTCNKIPNSSQSENSDLINIDLSPIQNWLSNHTEIRDILASTYCEITGGLFLVVFVFMIGRPFLIPFFNKFTVSGPFGSPISTPSSSPPSSPKCVDSSSSGCSSPQGFGSPIDPPSSPR